MFRIRNKETGEYYTTLRGKTIWKGENHAKNAWNTNTSGGYRGRPSFDQQDRLEVVEVTVIPKEDYERLIHDSNWLGCLEAAGVDNWIGYEDAIEIYEGTY